MTSTMVRNRLIRFAALLFWLIVWQVAAMLANRSLLIPVPTPVSTAHALLQLAGQLSFWYSVGMSLLRITVGFLLALVAGTVCALLSSRFSFFRILTAPLLQTIRSIPVASFTILVFLWIARGKIPSVISFLTVFPLVWANVETGADNVNHELREMASVFGMSKLRVLTEITLPEIHPHFISAVAGGLGFAWKSGVAAEIICRTSDSIGNLLWAGKSIVDYDEVFALTVVIIFFSTLLQKAATSLLRGGSEHAGN